MAVLSLLAMTAAASGSGVLLSGPPPAINCPGDTIVNNDPGMCSAVVYYTPPANATRITGPASGSSFPVGTTIVVYKENGSSDTCFFYVTVVDAEAPVINCPEDICRSYDAGLCQAITYPMPTATDNCFAGPVTQTAGLTSGSVFPPGPTLNVFEVSDTAGNTTTCSFTVTIGSPAATALRSDGSSSSDHVPQGALRYQRELYLITPLELASSGLVSGMAINSIGFTIAAASDDTAKGSFRLYLQNTNDIQSRMDTAWTTVTSASPSYPVTGLSPGNWEWQVRAVCSGTSGYSGSASFANEDLGGCNQPYNLAADPVTHNSATLKWECVSSPGFTSYQVRYHTGSTGSWQTFTTTDTFYVATGLSEDTLYQWEVKTVCGSGYSQVGAGSFQTGMQDLCQEPSNPVTGTLGDTSANLSWTAASGASYYELNYRRSGTSYWYSLIVPGDHYLLQGLEPGTVYDWKVRTTCTDGKGSFVNGSPFITSGIAVCYPPDETKTSGISATGATFKWIAVPGASSYSIRYRMKESISWTNAITPMTLVCDSTVTLPDSIGFYDIPFPQGVPFTYSGNGLYVAWEFSRPGGIITSTGKALCTKANTVVYGAGGLDSLRLVMCLNGKTDSMSTSLPAILSSTNFRPETRFGSPGLKDSVAIVAIFGTGHLAIPYGNPADLSVLVRNFQNKPVIYPVTLTVRETATGTSRHAQTVNVTVPAYCTGTANFSAWSPQEYENDSVIISIPGCTGENVLGNNTSGFIQKVNPYQLGYADRSEAVTGAGYGNEGGKILVRHTLAGCGQVISAQVYLHSSSSGHALYAVLLDSTKTLVDSSASFTPDTTDANNYYSFFFPNPPVFTNSDFYVGVVQEADPLDASTPVGLQWEGPYVRKQTYYGVHSGSNTLADDVFQGRPMIRAEIIPGMPVPEIGGNLTLCAGDTVTLSAAATTSRFASSVKGYSSQYGFVPYNARQVLGTPDVYPVNAANPGVWLSETSDGQREYLVLEFPDPAPADFIDIYETYNPGAVDTVYVKNTSGIFVPVWTDSAVTVPQSARIKHITFTRTAYDVSEIRIAINSMKITGFNAIDAVVMGTYDNPATFSSYAWTPGGATTQTIKTTTSGSYTLAVTGPSGCQSSATADVVTPVSVTPVITAGGPTTFCQGDSVVLTSSLGEGNTWSTGETTQSITVKVSGNYTVTVDNGCSSITSASTQVNVNPLPTVTVTGGFICPGASGTLDAGPGFSGYLWSTGATTQTISVSSPGVFTVTVTDGNGCKANGGGSAMYAPAPVPVISGDPYFCPGDSTVLDAGAGYVSYAWSTGDTTQHIRVKTLGTFSVTVTNTYGCQAGTSVTTHHYPLPNPVITGTFSLCAGTTTVLDAGAGFEAYLWSTGETTHSIVVDSAGTYTVTVTDFNGCKGSASATITQDGAIPATPGPIDGPVTGVCNATGLVYTIDPVPNTTHYVWTVPAGMTITGGQGTTSITVDVGSFDSGIITVAASNACGQSPSWTPCNLTVYGTPGDPGAISGQATAVCGIVNVPYSVAPAPGATQYLWTVPAGATITGGQGTAAVTISFSGSFSGGNICVTTSSSCGTGNPSCLAVSGSPLAPGAITGPVQVCKKQKFVSYSIQPVTGASTYTWTVPPQSMIVTGQGTTGILVVFGTQSGIVGVTA